MITVNSLMLEIEQLELLLLAKDNALKSLMAAYERRIRSDCTTPEQIEAQPWRCHEYAIAEHALSNQPRLGEE